MSFEAFAAQFFQGMPALPAHVLASYKAFYEAGRDEGNARMQCPGCGGQKSVTVRVQRRINGRRVCDNDEMPCPICHGTGIATDKDVEAFLARD